MLANTLLISYFLSSVISVLICAGQEVYSFRQTTGALQIYYHTGEWLNVSTRGFDGREGIIVCNNITNEAFVEFQINTTHQEQTVRVNCNDLPEKLEDCRDISEESANSIVSNVTCFDFSDYQLGDIRLLEDGRIVQLVDRNGYYAWSHYCVEENDNWDMNTSNLACQTLGYERASGDFISIEGKYVSGIENIDCTGASDFLHCTSNTLNSQLIDCFRGTIAIKCEGLITPQPMSTIPSQTTTEITTKTTTKTTTQLTTETSKGTTSTP